MIIFITDQQVRKNFKAVGFKVIDNEIVSVVNNASLNFVRKVLNKTLAKYKGASEIEGQHVQTGGRVLMPAEYFGVSTNHYIGKSLGTDMSVTPQLIRPSFSASDLVTSVTSVGSAGSAATLQAGGNHGGFHVTLQAVKNMCAEVLNTTRSKGVVLKQSAYKEIHAALTSKLDKVLVSVRKNVKGETVTKKDMTTVLAMAKFKALA